MNTQNQSYREWQDSVVYQIYPKSFCDSTGNGIGDLPGIISKLDYLQMLGVDYLWLTPFYPSPQRDNGYDVADYCSVDPRFGTMADFEQLVEEAGQRGMKLMLDMVFNHTSTDHEWFQKALAGDKTYQDYYIFREPVDGGAPTNWESKFGGNAWEYVPALGEYYLHLFDKTQADLNWENPVVREEIYKVVNFWLEKGVKGFRLDVINLISKPDVLENDNEGDGRRFYTDGPRIHEYLKELNARTFGRYDDVITVGEMSSTSIDNCIRYSNPRERELSMTFSFHHLKVDYPNGEKWKLAAPDLKQLNDLYSTWQEGMTEGGGWNALFWCNHDQPRIVSRLGDDKNYRERSAKMLGAAIHLMRGTPYIYQGEEIGMTNAGFTSLKQYRDVESINHYQLLSEKGLSESEVLSTLAERSRDNARTPMQWDDSQHAGFTTGTPWIEAAGNYTSVNVQDARENGDSVYHFYRKLIQLRKQHRVIVCGDYAAFEQQNSDVLAYLRAWQGDELAVFCNLTGDIQEVDVRRFGGYQVLVNNAESVDVEEGVLRLEPWQVVALFKQG